MSEQAPTVNESQRLIREVERLLAGIEPTFAQRSSSEEIEHVWDVHEGPEGGSIQLSASKSPDGALSYRILYVSAEDDEGYETWEEYDLGEETLIISRGLSAERYAASHSGERSQRKMSDIDYVIAGALLEHYENPQR